MFKIIQILFAGILMLVFCTCKKEVLQTPQDKFISIKDELSPLKAEVSGVGLNFIELQWQRVTSSHFRNVTYSVYIKGKKIVEDLNVLSYSLINLTQGEQYEIKIVASTSDGKLQEQTLNVNTLSPSQESLQVYAEYKIHDFSRLMGTTKVIKHTDGGHLIAQFLQHPNYFSEENYKLIVYRTNEKAEIIWYRLLSTTKYDVQTTDPLVIFITQDNKECILFAKQHAIKLSIGTGEILFEKKLSNNGDIQSLHSAHQSATNIIAGNSSGALLAIDPITFNIIWYRGNASSAPIEVINQDSKRNIYYIFRDSEGFYGVRKCTPEGVVISDYFFDDELRAKNEASGLNTLLIDADDNFYFIGSNSFYYSLRYFKFDKQGKLLKRDTQREYVTATKSFFNTKGDIIITGQQNFASLNTYGATLTFDKDMNLKTKQLYSEIPAHIIRDVTDNLDGSYNLFLNFMQTPIYENSNFIYIQTSKNGKI